LDVRNTPFTTTRLNAFTVEVNQTAVLDFTLSVGSLEQSVTVDAQAVRVEAATAELGSVISQRQVVDLPLNGRNFTQLLALQPGATPVSTAQTGGGNGGLRSSINPAVNGATNRSNQILIDGMLNLAFQTTAAIPPIIDTIQEFKVQSHNDQAEYGGVLGGIINVATKSGTNQLYGSAWEFVRNNAFDARGPFLATVLPYRWNQFGGMLGGPVYVPKLYNGRNRTFFMIAYEGDRLHQPGTNFYNVPTAAQYAGDFNSVKQQIFDPFSTVPDPAKVGQFLRTPFPGNQIPVSKMDPAVIYYAKTLLPTTPSATLISGFNSLDTTPTIDAVNSYQMRFDQVISQKDLVFFRWTGRIDNQTSSGGIAHLIGNQYSDAKSYVLAYTHTFSPTTVITFEGGRIWQPSTNRVKFEGGFVPSDFFQKVGFSPYLSLTYSLTGTQMVPGLSPAGYWGVSGGGISGGYENANGAEGLDNRELKGDLTKIIGRHTIKIGAELDNMEFLNGNAQAVVQYQPTNTADPEALGTTGNALASLFLNVPNNLQTRNNIATVRNGFIAVAFAEDQWKVSDRLTLNFGLRYDRVFFPKFGTTALHDKYIGTMDFNNGTYLVQDVPASCAQLGQFPCIPTPDGGLPAHVVDNHGANVMRDFAPRNLGPRFGFAYRLNQQTVLRGGFGIFYDTWAGLMQLSQNLGGVWPDSGQLLLSNMNNPSADHPNPTVTGTNPLAGQANALWPTPTPFTAVQWYYDPNLKDPYSMQWNFGVQREIGQNSVLTVNYVGSGARRVDIGSPYNTALTPGPGNPQARALYPYVVSTYWDRSWGRSSYEGLQVLFEKKYSNGLALTASFTRSKTIDYACDGWFGVEGCSNQDPYHIANDRSVAGFDIPNSFTLGAVYALPFGKGKPLRTGSSALNYVIGNWQLNTITVLRSGQPYTVVLSGDVANTGNANSSYMRPNLIGITTPSNQTPNGWILSSGFATPAAFTFGNLGRNTFRSDWGKNVDLSVFREFPVKERLTFVLRTEAFNLFNVSTFGVPINNLTNPNFGKVTSLAVQQPRELQLSLKVRF
jgi:hypothetical protein